MDHSSYRRSEIVTDLQLAAAQIRVLKSWNVLTLDGSYVATVHAYTLGLAWREATTAGYTVAAHNLKLRSVVTP